MNESNSCWKTQNQTNIFQLFRNFGELKNMSLSPCNDGDEDQYDRPPILSWGFINENPNIDAMIIEAIKAFPSKIKWHFTYREGWWALFPEYILEIMKRENIDGYEPARSWLRENEPEFGRMANRELARFANYLKEFSNVKRLI